MELLIQHDDRLYYPSIEDGMTLTWERKGVPGQLRFSVVADGVLQVEEGDAVRLSVDGVPLFYGFVFTIKGDKGSMLDITAYDQLRYLKNKDTYAYEALTAAQLIRTIAADFNLQCGVIEDTGYVIEAAVEQDQTLFDMIQNALDATLLSAGRLYVLYDDCGKLTVRNIESMVLGLLIDAATGESINYTSTIDEGTANKIKLAYDNTETGLREIYIAQDGEAMNRWGVLQHFEAVTDVTNAQAKVDALLELYNQKTKRISVSGAFGDIRVRAGCSLMVSLTVAGETLNRLMVVEKVKHTFDRDHHTMTLNLIGGEFVA